MINIKKKLDSLLENDFHLVERRKIIFAIPIAVVVLAVVMMIIFRFTIGTALNLGTDFTGGYSVDIKLGNALTDSNYTDYYSQIEEVFERIEDENGNIYKVNISGAMQRQGSGDDASIHVKYASVNGVSESEMSRLVNPAIITALENRILKKVPNVKIDGNIITVAYDEVINADNADSPFETLKNAFLDGLEKLNADNNSNITVTDSSIVRDESDAKKIVITSSSPIVNSKGLRSDITTLMSMTDNYSGSVTGGNLVGATVSTELLFNAVLAVVLALIFMLCYIGLRFQLSSGLACIIALFHDILMMFAFMAIFHIEINSTFIAALITILGYSINNSIILFDRVRENMKSVYVKKFTPEEVANRSIRETLLRSINTTITTLIMIAMVAIIGVSDIRIFAFPIIIGLLSGTFSSVCIAPSFWALFQRVGRNRDNFNLEPKNKNKKKDKTRPAKTEA